MHSVKTSLGKQIKCLILVKSYQEQEDSEIKCVKLLLVLSIYISHHLYSNVPISLSIPTSSRFSRVCLLFTFHLRSSYTSFGFNLIYRPLTNIIYLHLII